VEAPLRIRARNPVGIATDGTWPHDYDVYSNGVIVGMRSIDRGDEFLAYLNCSDVQPLTAGSSCTIVSASAGFGPCRLSPLGRAVSWNPAGAIFEEVVELGIGPGKDFYGIFHAFLRLDSSNMAADELSAQVQLHSGDIEAWTSPLRPVHVVDTFAYVDLDQVVIPGSGIPTHPSLLDPLLSFHIWMGNDNIAGADVWIYDLILIPVDEWAGMFVDPTAGYEVSGLTRWLFTDWNSRQVDIDPVSYPREPFMALAEDYRGDDGALVLPWLAMASRMPFLWPDRKVRLWFFSIRARDDGAGARVDVADQYLHHAVRLTANRRYMSGRGDKP
jgi:hypothetical protein